MGLEMVELVMDIEDRFGVDILDHQASTIETVGQMQDVIVELLIAKGQADRPELRDEVWHGIVEIVADQMGIDRSQIKPESRWVGDITKDG